MVMGNASGRKEGEGTSGAKDEEGYVQEEEGMDFLVPHTHPGYHPQGAYLEADPMAHSPPHSPRRHLRPPLLFSPQVPVVPFLRPGEAMHAQNYALTHQTSDVRDVFREKLTAVMITWNHDGKRVAVTGSWDNWGSREPLQRSGRDLILMKMLPSGVYHYRFIVDGHVRYAPDLPWESDDSGTAYNILDVQEYVPEATESLSEFESPPSPESSYNNESLNENDFSKPPPDLPPQIQQTLLNERASAINSHETLPRPQNAVLNHLYIQNNSGQSVGLGSTHRFLQKYVTVVLYQPSRR